MKQDISNNGGRSPLTRHHVVSQGIADAFANTRDMPIHHEECAVLTTPWTRQNNFKDALDIEGVKRILDASLRVDGNIDALDSEPAVAHANFAQKVGAAGLAELQPTAATARLFISSENSD